MDRLAQPDIDSVEQQAILLAWAEMQLAALAKPSGRRSLARARVLFLEDPDPGVHSAAELLLSRWGEPDLLERLKPSCKVPPRAIPASAGRSAPTSTLSPCSRARSISEMGSPPGKGEFYGSPGLHYRKIDRSIACGDERGHARAIPEIQGRAPERFALR